MNGTNADDIFLQSQDDFAGVRCVCEENQKDTERLFESIENRADVLSH